MSPLTPTRVAGAIDIGSNTIKMLVLQKKGNSLKVLAEQTCETRIGTGIGKAKPVLRKQNMDRAAKVVNFLFRKMVAFNPAFIRIVATSAVREARNRDEFIGLIRDITGTTLEVISGDREADLIAKGILTDPNLKGQKEIVIFDLGGGSVECIHILEGQVRLAQSLPLGGVRIMESFLTDASSPLSDSEANLVEKEVMQRVSDLPLALAHKETVLGVGTGGTISTARAILAGRTGRTLEESSPYMTLEGLRSVFQEVRRYHLDRRLRIPSMPPNRADVFPVSLLILIVLGQWAGVKKIFHTFHNLRFGLAAELLSPTSPAAITNEE